MSFVRKRSWVSLADEVPELTTSGLHNVWHLLENFVRQLQHTDDVRRQIRLILETIREATGAEVVLLGSSEPGQPIEFLGGPGVTEEWSRRVLRHLLPSVTGGRADLLRPNCKIPGLSPAPTSAAIMRLSKSRSAWILALHLQDRVFSVSDLRLMRLARRMLIQQQQHTQMHQRMHEALFGLVRCLTAALDARDPYTCGHSERVARIGVRLAQQMQLSETEQNDIYLGGLLHDIGKIGVNDEVLRKPGALTPEERIQIEKHTVIGDAILSHVSHLSYLRPAVRSHHEHFNGTGYPDRLAGEDIPRIARVLAVADSCDAMMSDRPYRKGIPAARIEAILLEGAGKQWDPEIIHHFMVCRADLYSVYQRGLGDSVVRAVASVLRETEKSGSGFMTIPSIFLPSQALQK